MLDPYFWRNMRTKVVSKYRRLLFHLIFLVQFRKFKRNNEIHTIETEVIKLNQPKMIDVHSFDFFQFKFERAVNIVAFEIWTKSKLEGGKGV